MPLMRQYTTEVALWIACQRHVLSDERPEYDYRINARPASLNLCTRAVTIFALAGPLETSVVP